MCNNDKCRFECKNLKEHNSWKKGYTWNPVTCSCENGKYLGSIIDNLVITCDEIKETIKSTSTKAFPTKTVPLKNTSTNFYILLASLLIIK